MESVHKGKSEAAWLAHTAAFSGVMKNFILVKRNLEYARTDLNGQSASQERALHVNVTQKGPKVGRNRWDHGRD